MNFNLLMTGGWNATHGLGSIARLTLAMILIALLGACGGGGVSSPDGGGDLASPLPVGVDDEGNLIPGAPGQPPVSSGDLALLPVVAVNARQIADPNVLIRLQGSVAAAAGAEIVRTLWVQVLGPDVVIEAPESLEQLVQVPSVTSTVRLQFRLTAFDSEGRINSASVSVIVQPVEGVEGPQDKLVQVIEFLEPGPFEVEVGANFSNSLNTSASPQGVGAVTYDSSNSSVASVDSNGLVFALAEGTAEITVIRAEDNVYLPASDSYTVVVIPATIEPTPDFLDFDAFIGISDTQFVFKYPVTGYEFIRTSNPDCSPFNECTDLLTDTLVGNTVVDSPTLTSTSYFWLASDRTSIDFTIGGATRGARGDAPPARGYHGMVATSDRLWLVGGAETDQFENGIGYYDAWSSLDAVSWQRTTEEFIQEGDFNEAWDTGVSEVIAYGDAVWVSVETGEGFRIYHSTDGAQWTREERVFQANIKFAVFEDRLFVYESTFDESGFASNVELWQYTSSLGWSEQSQILELTDLSYAQFVEFDGSLWMFAGYASDQIPLRASTDGVTWAPVETNVFDPLSRFDFQPLVFNGELWFFDLDSGTILRSVDGLEWEAVEADKSLMPHYSKLAVFDNKLWLHGGIDFESNDGEITKGDTWVSEDGVVWRKVFRGVVSFIQPM